MKRVYQFGGKNACVGVFPVSFVPQTLRIDALLNGIHQVPVLSSHCRALSQTVFLFLSFLSVYLTALYNAALVSKNIHADVDAIYEPLKQLLRGGQFE